MSAIYLVV